MVDAYRFAEYLDRTKLREKEFWLLYRIMILSNNIKDGVFRVPNLDKNQASFNFSVWSQSYQERFKDDEDWRGILEKLEREYYVEIWDKVNYNLGQMKVTKKFTDNFIVDDIEQAFMEFVKIYPKRVVVKNQFGGKFYPSFNQSPEVLQKLYSEKILKGGNKLLHDRCLFLTEMYLEELNSVDAPYNIENYINKFEGIAMMMEDKDNSSNTDWANNDI